MGALFSSIPVENLVAVAVAAVILSFLAARKNRRQQDGEEAKDVENAQENGDGTA